MAKLTQEEKDAIRDAGVAEWWKDWYAADYSWEGLTQYPWQGWIVVEDEATYNNHIKIHGLPSGSPHKACQVVADDCEALPDATKTRKATLQDYWRDQENNLQREEGQKTYTIAHLPVHYADGEESWKSDPDHKNWHYLSDHIKERLARGVRTNADLNLFGDQVLGQDGLANFRGCVLPALPSAIHTAKTDASDDTPSDIGPDHTGSDMDGALHLSLHQAAIVQSQDFRGTIFGSATDFRKTLYASGDANFDGAQFSGGDASFHGAQFSGGYASFHGAQFSGGYAYFRGAQFSGGHAYFSYAQFSGEDADFNFAKFSGGDASFHGAQFSGGNASFIGAQFSGGYANFRRTQFSGGNADFRRTQFSGGNADFSGAQFSGGDADFNNALFKNSFHFINAQFGKAVRFENTQFPPSGGSHDAFRGTQFLGPATFIRTEFKAKDGSPLPASQLHFPFNAFGLANFKDQLTLTQRGDRAAQIEFNQALTSTADACRGKDRDFTESRYVALESGCTTLKRAMESVSDKNRAQRYFKFELLARQQRPSTPRLVKLFTKLYGLTADYGGSISRPLLALLILWLGFSAFYGVNAVFADVELSFPKKIWGAMDFSATHIFRPLFIWSKTGTGEDLSWLSQYRDGLTAGGWLFIKLLATLQSFLSLTLLFLFGLATKRKFQIS